MAKRDRIAKVTDEQIVAMANTGVSDASTDQTVAERSGSDDKVAAVKAENAPPRVPTYTTEGRAWIDADPYGLKLEGRYGKKGQTALQYEDLQRHAQFRGVPNDVAELELIHGKDDTAPKDRVTCPICNELVTSFVRTALIDRTGDLRRDKDSGAIIYRGQFVAVGPDALNLTVHGAHSGECLFMLRIRRDRDGNAMREEYLDNKGNKRSRWMMLDGQSFDQANVRVVAVRNSILAKRDERTASENAMKSRLGFKAGSGGNRTDDGIDRGSFAPTTPRGQSRKQRRWAEADIVSE